MIGRNQALHVHGAVRWVQVGGPSIDPPHLEALVRSPHAGAVIVFLGTTRDDAHDDGIIEALEYEAARPLADEELMRVAQEATQNFHLTAIAVHHALGRIDVNGSSLAVVVSAPHRAEAFAAIEWTVHAIKTRVPIWKRTVVCGSPGSGSWLPGTPVIMPTAGHS